MADTQKDIIPDEPPEIKEIALQVKWNGKFYPVEILETSTVIDLKARLFELTEVLPKRQKLAGFKNMALVNNDQTSLSQLAIKQDQKIMLIGSREVDISKIEQEELAVKQLEKGEYNRATGACASSNATRRIVVNDLDQDVEYDSEEDSKRSIHYWKTIEEKMNRRINNLEVTIINPFRDGKKLLVLDLDYTLFDCKSTASRISELSRPGLHEFLAGCYKFYDIVIWSQTSWRWLEAKITELGMLFHPDYKIAFVLDRTAMFSITSRRGGVEKVHEVKALNIIWKKFSERWNSSNSIHIDDLGRNFALNPQSGLKIAPFKNAHVMRQIDQELPELAKYLKLIAKLETDFTRLNHKYWKLYISQRARELMED